MNDCPRAQQLMAYGDGELSAADRREFQRHLPQCESCSSELPRLERLAGELCQMPQPAVPRAMVQRLHQSVDRLQSRGTIRLAEVCTAVAAMVLLACMLNFSDQAAALPSPPSSFDIEAMVQEPSEPPSTASGDVLASWMVQDLSTGGDQ
jgi:anti-sigma factor RsiW